MRDADVRAALLKSLADQYAGDGDETRIVQEMSIWSNSVRIDVAVINGELTGYELKSDRDTLERLPFQAELYSRVFDRITLVVGSKHSQRAIAVVPGWWGVIVARKPGATVNLALYREAQTNPGADPYLVAQLLWKSEAIAVLARHGFARGWKSKPVKAIHEKLASELPLAVLKFEVRSCLKQRQDWLRQKSPHDFNVTVDCNLDPMLKPLRRSVTSRNRVNFLVGPTSTECMAVPIISDAGCVPSQLNAHVDAPESCSWNTATDQKVCVQSVSHVDWEAPCDAGRGRDEWNRRVIAIVKRIGRVWRQ